MVNAKFTGYDLLDYEVTKLKPLRAVKNDQTVMLTILHDLDIFFYMVFSMDVAHQYIGTNKLCTYIENTCLCVNNTHQTAIR